MKTSSGNGCTEFTEVGIRIEQHEAPVDAQYRQRDDGGKDEYPQKGKIFFDCTFAEKGDQVKEVDQGSHRAEQGAIPSSGDECYQQYRSGNDRTAPGGTAQKAHDSRGELSFGKNRKLREQTAAGTRGDRHNDNGDAQAKELIFPELQNNHLHRIK